MKRGFARNYLISNKKALYASKENISQVEKIKSDLSKKIMREKKKLNKFLKKSIKKSILLKNLVQKIMSYTDLLNQLKSQN